MNKWYIFVAAFLMSCLAQCSAQQQQRIHAGTIVHWFNLEPIPSLIEKLSSYAADYEIYKINEIDGSYTLLQRLINFYQDAAVINVHHKVKSAEDQIAQAQKLGDKLSQLSAALVCKGACPFMDSENEHRESALFIALRSSMPQLGITLFESASMESKRRFFALNREVIQSKLQEGFKKYVNNYNTQYISVQAFLYVPFMKSNPSAKKRKKCLARQRTSLYKKHHSQAVEYFKNISPNVAFYGGLNKVKNFFDLRIVFSD